MAAARNAAKRCLASTAGMLRRRCPQMLAFGGWYRYMSFQGCKNRLEPIRRSLDALQMRILESAVIVDALGAKAVVFLEQQFDRFIAALRGGDRRPQQLRLLCAAVDREQGKPAGQSRLECGAAPQNINEAPVIVDREAERVGEIRDLAIGVRVLGVLGRLFGIHERPSGASQSVQRRTGAMPVETRAQEGRPIEGLHGIQGMYDIVESIGKRFVAAVSNAEEIARKIIQGVLVA